MKVTHVVVYLVVAGTACACNLQQETMPEGAPNEAVGTQLVLRSAVDATLTALIPTFTPFPATATPQTAYPGPGPSPEPPQPVTPIAEPSPGYPPPAPEPVTPTILTPTPTTLRTPTPWPTATPTATPLPTRIYAQYDGPIFDLVFLRGGNLWLAVVGGGGERQVTFETGDWWVTEYAVTRGRIVYFAKRHEYSWGHDYAFGARAVEVVGRRLDPLSGKSVVILDDLGRGDSHLLACQDGHVDILCEPLGVTWRVDVETGERTPLRRPEVVHTSPDGRYQVSIPIQHEMGQWVALSLPRVTDLETDESWRVEIEAFPIENQDSGWFHGWSPSGRYLLLAGRRKDGALRTVLHLVDLRSREVRVLNPSETPSLGWAVWAPDEEMIYATRCESADPYAAPSACSLVTVDPSSGEVADLPAPVPMAARHIGWACGGERLVFTVGHGEVTIDDGSSGTVWTARREGGDLSPIVWAADRPTVLDPEACEQTASVP